MARTRGSEVVLNLVVVVVVAVVVAAFLSLFGTSPLRVGFVFGFATPLPPYRCCTGCPPFPKGLLRPYYRLLKGFLRTY